jgi:hypothetical protein
VAAAEAAFNALLARVAAEAEAKEKGAARSGNGNGNAEAEGEGEDVATAMARLLKATGGADDDDGGKDGSDGVATAVAGALSVPLWQWNVHRFEGWVGGVLGEIGASEVGTCM